METKFEVGDKVRAFGLDGFVKKVEDNVAYPIRAAFLRESGDMIDEIFTLDGRNEFWHKEPSLVLVEKAKKEEPIVQWYSVLAQIKGNARPTTYYGPYKNEEDFLNVIGFANDNFDWIKLIPMCKTQGNKFVEE